jgi:hypothetical protein
MGERQAATVVAAILDGAFGGGFETRGAERSAKANGWRDAPGAAPAFDSSALLSPVSAAPSLVAVTTTLHG